MQDCTGHFRGYEEKLAFLDSLDGALISAGAAGNADISVDNVLAFALGNSLNGALIGAGAAGDTSVSDNVCHDFYLHNNLVCVSRYICNVVSL